MKVRGIRFDGACQAERLFERREGLRDELREVPLGELRRCAELVRRERHRRGPAIAVLRRQRSQPGREGRRAQGVHRLAIARHEDVDVCDVTDPCRCTVGGAGDDRAAVALAHEDDVDQLLDVEQVDDGGDVGVEIDCRVRQVSALTVAGQARPVRLVTTGDEQVRDGAPLPATAPAAMNEHVRRRR